MMFSDLFHLSRATFVDFDLSLMRPFQLIPNSTSVYQVWAAKHILSYFNNTLYCLHKSPPCLAP
jgi:hypothetical protein